MLVVSAALLAGSLAWAAYVGRDRPTPAELAGREFYAAALSGECDIADALLTDDERARTESGAEETCTDESAGPRGTVVGARTRQTGDRWAIVVVQVTLDEQSERRELPLGMRYEADGGRWQVARVGPECLEPVRAHPLSSCSRWDWP